MHEILLITLCLIMLSVPSKALAWGERGHDLVTRVAVKTLADLTTAGSKLTEPFAQRDHMLSHLSNAPDFHWRAEYMSERERELNFPTHFIGLESVYENARHLSDIDQSYSVFADRAKQNNIEHAEKIGTAPWRALQLYSRMVAALSKASEAETSSALIEATNEALLNAGLMSHFIGDLANPHHTSLNYNGQLSGNTGLHAYFESDIVRELPLSLDTKIEQLAGLPLLKQTILAPYSDEQAAEILQDPSQLIFALALDSHSKLDYLHSLDNEYAIVRRSKDATTNAIRKPANEVMAQFEPLIIERLSVGATVLAQLWQLAWQAAEEPDLSDFRSYEYFLMPAFVEPDYLQE